MITILEQLCDEVKLILIQKRQDYGPIDNTIGRFGMQGIIVRLTDKNERLINLVINGKEANFESVEDTLIDIVGYAVLGLELLRKTKREGSQ